MLSWILLGIAIVVIVPAAIAAICACVMAGWASEGMEQ